MFHFYLVSNNFFLFNFLLFTFIHLFNGLDNFLFNFRLYFFYFLNWLFNNFLSFLFLVFLNLFHIFKFWWLNILWWMNILNHFLFWFYFFLYLFDWRWNLLLFHLINLIIFLQPWKMFNYSISWVTLWFLSLFFKILRLFVLYL